MRTDTNEATVPDGLHEKGLVLDVRTSAEYAEMHIPGSLNVPLHELGRYLTEVRETAGERDLLVVCRTGRRASAACRELARAGLGNSSVLEGGIESWVASGGEVRRGHETISLERQVRIAAGALVALGTALGVLVDPWFLLLPALVGCGLVFAGVTDTCGMGMLIARMPWNRARPCDVKGPPGEVSST